MEALDPDPVTISPEHDRKVCEGKVAYRTKANARAQRDRLRRTHPQADLYQCHVCKAFHITRVPTENDRRLRRAARDGELVSIGYDPNPGAEIAIGDGLETPSGRQYLIVGFRVQERGKHRGRYHLLCAVNQPITGTTHPLVWYPRQ